MIPSAFFAFILFSLPGPSPSVAGQPRCIEVIRWSGKTEDVSIVREALGGGILASQAGVTCRGVGISVGFSQGRWTFRLRRDDKTVTHVGPDLQVAATWVESLLVPPVGIPMPTPGGGPDPGAGVVAVPVVAATRAGPPLLATLFSGAALAADYQGLGLCAELDLRLGSSLWSGISAGWIAMPEQSGVRRDQITFQVLAGSRFTLKHMDVLPGVGLGVGHMELAGSGEKGEESPVEATRSDLLFSLFVRAQLALTDRVRLLLELNAQFSLVNLSTKVSAPGEDENSGQETEKVLKANAADEAGLPTNRVVFLVRLGLAWRWGGW